MTIRKKPTLVKKVYYARGVPGTDAEITKEKVEEVLIGEITTHTHPGGSGSVTNNSYMPSGW